MAVRYHSRGFGRDDGRGGGSSALNVQRFLTTGSELR